MTSDEPPWELEDVEEAHAESPDTFRIADRAEREGLPVGSSVTLIFLVDLEDEERGPFVQGERLDVTIAERRDGRYVGRIEDGSALLEELAPGTRIPFGPEHVATVIVRSPRGG